MRFTKSPNFGERRGEPRLIVIHYTGMESAGDARARLMDPEWQVSAHYMIGESGDVERLVEERHRAWHAGEGSWGGARDVNSISIGIELVNSGQEPFAMPQMKSLDSLLGDIRRRIGARPEDVIGHSDLAPDRKRDPGRKFDWRRLALQGHSVWLDIPAGGALAEGAVAAGSEGDFRSDLERIGYGLRDSRGAELPTRVLLEAFRQRFRPAAFEGLDASDMWLAREIARRHPANPIA